MSSQTYSKKRDELLGIIESVLNVADGQYVKGINDSERQVLEQTQQRLVSNQFNIVLTGEFQGGKSTLFDALCGGREISPRGAMIKTSAIAITATNLPNEDEEEYAVVHWKSNRELLQTMNFLIPRLPFGEMGIGAGNGSSNDVYNLIDLGDEKHLKALRKALEEEKSSISSLPPEARQGRIDMCYVVDVILTFCQDKKIAEYRSGQKKHSVSEISRFCTFPETWERNANNPSDFQAEDILFAFIGSVDVYIHSEALKRLGCSVTDCPGLFASAWDTAVATSAMARANAIIYLLSGARQMTEGDKKAITTINEYNSLRDKVYYTINKRENSTLTKSIIDQDETILAGMGIRSHIYELNILLLFLAEFGDKFIKKAIDDFSKERFLNVASRVGCEQKDVEDAWVELVTDTGYKIKSSELKSVSTLSVETADLVKSQSNYDGTIPEIEKEILSNRAHSILVDNGAEVAKRTLNGVEARLEIIQQTAESDEHAARARFEEAREKFSEFKQDIPDILASHFNERLEILLANDACKEVLNNAAVNEIVDVVSEEVMTVVGGLKQKRYDNEATTTEVRDSLMSILHPAIAKEIENRFSVWYSGIATHNNDAYNLILRPEITRANDELLQRWQHIMDECNLVSPEPPYLSVHSIELAMPQQIGDAVAANVSRLLDDVDSSLVEKIVNTVGAAIIAVLTYLTGEIFTNPKQAFKDILDVLLGKSPELSEEQKEEIKLKIHDGLLADFNSESNIAAIKDGLTSSCTAIVESIRDNYNTEMQNKEQELNDSINAAIEAMMQTTEKRRSIAAEAQQMRTTQIHPVIEKIETFCQTFSE